MQLCNEVKRLQAASSRQKRAHAKETAALKRKVAKLEELLDASESTEASKSNETKPSRPFPLVLRPLRPATTTRSGSWRSSRNSAKARCRCPATPNSLPVALGAHPSAFAPSPAALNPAALVTTPFAMASTPAAMASNQDVVAPGSATLAR
eukprot:scaffold128_cov248-Pinguiococcus_pyrenoidosus.AAC.15